MAILGRFECQVLGNGKPLKEYVDDDDEQDHENAVSGEDASSKSSVKYIKAVAGANFAIRWRVKPGFRFEEADFLAMDIFLDGQYSDEIVLTRDDYSMAKKKMWSMTRFGAYSETGTKECELRRFRFGEIVKGELLTSTNVEELKLKYDQLGSIEVKIWRYKTLSISEGGEGEAGGEGGEGEAGEEGEADGEDEAGGNLEAEEVIPEKMLKGRALTIRTSLEQAEKDETEWCTVDGKELGDYPIATFLFKYRSTEALKQLLVIPRTRSPTPLEERPIEGLSMEELRERLRRAQAETEDMKARVKKEKAQSSLDTLHAVKRFREDSEVNAEDDVVPIAERSAHKKQRPAVEQEVIELSD